MDLLDEIMEDIRAGRLKLPMLPDVALKVRAAVQDPDRSLNEVARIIQLDPALSARLVQVVNSPLYRGNRTIDSCHAAITRLGLRATRNLVTSFTLRRLFQPRDQRLAERLRRTWQHSCKVAAVSGVLARITPGMDPDRAMLAGLVHDIGELPLIQYAEQQQPPLDADGMRSLLERLRGALGVFVLKSWRFEPGVAEVPRQVEDWVGRDGVPLDYGDIVQVAHVHARFGEGHEGPALTELASFRKLPLSRLGPDASLELLRESQQEIREMVAILSG